MAIPITVPRLGWSMDEGTFVGWLKEDGAPVKAGEPLFTLEGDKATQEIEATHEGILRIPPGAPRAGDVVAVGALLGYLAAEGESLPTGGSSGGPEAAETTVVPEAPEVPQAVADLKPETDTPAVADRDGGPSDAAAATISPRARRRAAALGLDYRRLKGTGRTGRITEADVLAAAPHAPPAAGSTLRRTIAQRTAESFARAPHFYLRTEVDAVPLVELRDRLLPDVEKATGIRLTLTDLLLRAQALALGGCPWANALWQDDHVAQVPGCDVGLVVGLESGLLIPRVRGADAGDWNALVRQRAALVEAARQGKLPAEAMQGGATSLSNLGNTGVDEFAAVIAPPQSSMLAVGRAAPRPFVRDGRLVIRTTLKLCLSVDHRVMDGAPAAKFLGRIVELIEHPSELARAS